MRFKVDENMPIEVAAILNAAGHDALTIHDDVLALAAEVSCFISSRPLREVIGDRDLR